MNHLLSDLYALMETREESNLVQLPGYKDCQDRLEQRLDQVQAFLGEDFREALACDIFECTQPDVDAAFAWGLRLGLALRDL